MVFLAVRLEELTEVAASYQHPVPSLPSDLGPWMVFLCRLTRCGALSLEVLMTQRGRSGFLSRAWSSPPALGRALCVFYIHHFMLLAWFFWCLVPQGLLLSPQHLPHPTPVLSQALDLGVAAGLRPPDTGPILQHGSLLPHTLLSLPGPMHTCWET